MSASPDQGDVAIEADAFRALSAWTFDFRSHLRNCAIALAEEEATRNNSSPIITVALLHRALVLACHRTIEAVQPHSSREIDRDGNRSKVA
jgi:hypothetical protein